MHYDISVLRAIVRLSRTRVPTNAESLLDRVSGKPSDLRLSLRRLSKAGLVRVQPSGVSLTLVGLAIAVSTMPPRAKTSKPAPVRRAA